jgi:hypothetical protein
LYLQIQFQFQGGLRKLHNNCLLLLFPFTSTYLPNLILSDVGKCVVSNRSLQITG